MPRFEFGPLYKFFTSAGLVLIVAAFVLPWAILRESSVLLITREQLTTLTPVARTAVEAKQLHAESVVHLYPWVSATLLVTGIALLATGLIKWNKRQKVVDEKEDNDLLLQRRGLATLDPEEADHRRNVEVAESIAAEREAGPDASDVTDRTAPSEPSSGADARSTRGEPSDRAERPGTGVEAQIESSPKASEALRHLETRSAYIEVEQHLFALLRRTFRMTHSVSTGVKVSSHSDLAADVVALAPKNSSEPDFVFELKYAAVGFPTKFAVHAHRQIRAVLRSMARTGRPHALAGVVIFVVDGAKTRARAEDLVASLQRDLDISSEPPIGMVVLQRQEIDDLRPEELRRLIDRSLSR